MEVFIIKCTIAAMAVLLGALTGSVWGHNLALVAYLCADAWTLLVLSPRVPTEMERLLTASKSKPSI